MNELAFDASQRKAKRKHDCRNERSRCYRNIRHEMRTPGDICARTHASFFSAPPEPIFIDNLTRLNQQPHRGGIYLARLSQSPLALLMAGRNMLLLRSLEMSGNGLPWTLRPPATIYFARDNVVTARLRFTDASY